MNNMILMLKKESKQFFRDPLTLFIGLLPFPIALIFRFGIPPLIRFLSPWFDLSGLEQFWAGLLVMISPMLFGFTGGFLFLDEKDQGLLPTLKITPIPDSLWILEKTLIPFLITVPGVLLQLALCGLVPPFRLEYIPLAFLAALEAPFFALLIGTFSKDKVQGMTTGKSLSAIMIPALLVFFIHHPLVHLAAVSPPLLAAPGLSFFNPAGDLFLCFSHRRVPLPPPAGRLLLPSCPEKNIQLTFHAGLTIIPREEER